MLEAVGSALFTVDINKCVFLFFFLRKVTISCINSLLCVSTLIYLVLGRVGLSVAEMLSSLRGQQRDKVVLGKRTVSPSGAMSPRGCPQ